MRTSFFSFPLPFLNLRNPPTSSSPSVQAGQHAKPAPALLSTHQLLSSPLQSSTHHFGKQPLHRRPKPTLLRGSTTPANIRPPTANKRPASVLQWRLALLRSSLRIVLPQPPTPRCSNEAGWVALPRIHKLGVPKSDFWNIVQDWFQESSQTLTLWKLAWKISFYVSYRKIKLPISLPQILES